jgi:hypothetical protein
MGAAASSLDAGDVRLFVPNSMTAGNARWRGSAGADGRGHLRAAAPLARHRGRGHRCTPRNPLVWMRVVCMVARTCVRPLDCADHRAVGPGQRTEIG